MANVLSPAEVLTRAATVETLAQLFALAGWVWSRHEWRSPDGSTSARPTVLTRRGLRVGVYLRRPERRDLALDVVGVATEVLGLTGAQAIDAVRRLLGDEARQGGLGQKGGGALAPVGPSDQRMPGPLPGLAPSADVVELAEQIGAAGIPLDVELAARQLAQLQAVGDAERARQLRALLDVVAPDGRAHVRWLPAAGRSGRWSSDPTIIDVSSGLRSVVRAPAGFVLLVVDLIAANAFSVANITFDAALVGSCAYPDPWLAIADVLADHGLPGLGREHAKDLFNRYIGGAGGHQLAEVAGLDERQHRRVRIALTQAFPRVVEWRAWTAERIQASGRVHVRSSGRWLDPTGCSVGQLLSRQSQLQVADHVDRAAVQLTQLLLSYCSAARVLANLRDGLLVEAPCSDVALMKQLIHRAFDAPPYLSAPVPFRVRIGTGSTWADAAAAAPQTTATREGEDDVKRRGA